MQFSFVAANRYGSAPCGTLRRSRLGGYPNGGALWLKFRSDERSEIIRRLDHETDAQVLGEAGYLMC